MIAKLIERVNMILRIRHIEQQCFIEVIHKILRIPINNNQSVMSYKGRFLLAASHSFSLMHRLAALSR